jgi:hypothetical protein
MLKRSAKVKSLINHKAFGLAEASQKSSVGRRATGVAEVSGIELRFL